MRVRFRNIVLRIHFIALVVAVLNAIVKSVTSFSLEGNIEFGVELLVWVSGLALFFSYFTQLRGKRYYFLIYPVALFILFVGLIFRGLLWAMLLSILFYPIIPDGKEYEHNGIIISTPFQGVMGMCCNYKVKERYLFIFEKNHGLLEVQGSIDFDQVRVNSNDEQISITYYSPLDENVTKTRVFRK